MGITDLGNLDQSQSHQTAFRRCSSQPTVSVRGLLQALAGMKPQRFHRYRTLPPDAGCLQVMSPHLFPQPLAGQQEPGALPLSPGSGFLCVGPGSLSVSLGLTDWLSLSAAHLPLLSGSCLCLHLMSACPHLLGTCHMLGACWVVSPSVSPWLSMCPHLSPPVGCQPPSASACWVPVCLCLLSSCPLLSLPVGYMSRAPLPVRYGSPPASALLGTCPHLSLLVGCVFFLAPLAGCGAPLAPSLPGGPVYSPTSA